MHGLIFELEGQSLGVMETGPGFLVELKRFASREISFYNYADNFDRGGLPVSLVEVSFRRHEKACTIQVELAHYYEYERSCSGEGVVIPELIEGKKEWDQLAEKLEHQNTETESYKSDENRIEFSYTAVASIEDTEAFCRQLILEIENDLKQYSRLGGWKEAGSIRTNP
jgi:hypothetical protein